jgi:aminoglycoside phosphotransferase family enzyme
LIQTHISSVLVANHFVYKIKKPVSFGFLDFSTLEKRQFYCQQEVRLNQRLSSDRGTDDFYAGNRSLFQERIAQGKIRDCHGDLPKENYESNALTEQAYLNNNEKFEAVDLEELKDGYPGLTILHLLVDTTSDREEDWRVIGRVFC